MKILVAEDNAISQELLRRVLVNKGYEVIVASDGKVAWDSLCQGLKPDLCILDIMMPQMSGLEVLQRVRQDARFRDMKTILCSTLRDRETIAQGAALGIEYYILKPFKPELVLQQVEKALAAKAAETATTQVLPEPESLLDTQESLGELGASESKRFDDPLTILVVDDKPAIVEHIRNGLSDTPWRVQSRADAGEAMEFCKTHLPDAILVSLSLRGSAAFSLFQNLRAKPRTKDVPVFAMSVKTATEEQGRAQQIGFSGIITKPIDAEDLKMKITRTLGLDTSYRYFELAEGALLVKIPAHFTPSVADDVASHLRAKTVEAVDSGFDKLILDLSEVKKADVNVIKLGLNAVHLCAELSLKHRMVGSEAVNAECKKFQETKDWLFENSIDDALAALSGNAPEPSPARPADRQLNVVSSGSRSAERAHATA